MVFTPDEATLGSNVPVDAFVIPVPDQVPPLVAVFKLNGVALEQTGVTAVIDAFAGAVIVTIIVSTALHVPEIE